MKVNQFIKTEMRLKKKTFAKANWFDLTEICGWIWDK